jgi:hypothetical protein
MKIVKHKSRVFYLLLGFAFLNLFNIAASDIPDGIGAALRTGNSKELAKFFNANVELVLLDQENIYSKSQAEQILRDFFITYAPQGFSIIHEGGKQDSKYAIGTLVTSKGSLRVYFLLKGTTGNYLIHQLRIEREDE